MNDGQPVTIQVKYEVYYKHQELADCQHERLEQEVGDKIAMS